MYLYGHFDRIMHFARYTPVLRTTLSTLHTPPSMHLGQEHASGQGEASDSRWAGPMLFAQRRCRRIRRRIRCRIPPRRRAEKRRRQLYFPTGAPANEKKAMTIGDF